ncbi:hypothetical protein SAMN05660242_1338 [Thermoanaerobacterium sp. RBIITD]|nr:hypothetical protein SAMN05660242_1338 [Thermoanaerobacterium sp. RBIITD]
MDSGPYYKRIIFLIKQKNMGEESIIKPAPPPEGGGLNECNKILFKRYIGS